ncbi:MAG: hypothetical protein ACTSSA_10275 [Candidatus Freyarchaeota archaeon]
MASTVLREYTFSSGSAYAAGIPSVINGLIGLVGFPLLFIASILWQAVFHPSKEFL